MKYKQLGSSDLQVSELSLGSMTWGTQNTMEEGHEQIDYALEAGVNLIDTAEMYPTNPLSSKTQGDTERIIGEWVAKSGRRKDVLIATKVSGAGYRRVRGGAPISRETILEAVETSLRSLQTDYIDLYQLHWPNRGSYMFRQNWAYDPSAQDTAEVLDNMEEVLETLGGLVAAGKIRAIGLSNESAWGTAQWMRIAREKGFPRMVSMQNEYSLMCRLYDTDMAELSHHEQIGLLAYSPLSVGMLSGKYQGGAVPDGSRKSIGSDLGGRATERAWLAVDAYLEVARKHGLDPCQMALAWCRTRPFMASAIFGATRMDQLKTALGSVEVELSEECLADISSAHRAHPMPY